MFIRNIFDRIDTNNTQKYDAISVNMTLYDSLLEKEKAKRNLLPPHWISRNRRHLHTNPKWSIQNSKICAEQGNLKGLILNIFMLTADMCTLPYIHYAALGTLSFNDIIKKISEC